MPSSLSVDLRWGSSCGICMAQWGVHILMDRSKAFHCKRDNQYIYSYSCLRKHCFCQKMLKAEIHCMLFRIFKSQSNVQNFGSKFSNTIFLLTPINEGNLVKIGPFEHPQLSNAIWPKSIRVSQMCVQTVGISWVPIPYYNVVLDQSLLNSPSLSLLETNIQHL